MRYIDLRDPAIVQDGNQFQLWTKDGKVQIATVGQGLTPWVAQRLAEAFQNVLATSPKTVVVPPITVKDWKDD